MQTAEQRWPEFGEKREFSVLHEVRMPTLPRCSMKDACFHLTRHMVQRKRRIEVRN